MGREVDSAAIVPEHLPFDEEHYRELGRRHVIRLFVTYLAPLILLTAYFYIQYEGIVAEGHRSHLRAVAESQANTLDLFLTERRMNLANLIDDPRARFPIPSEQMAIYLNRLRSGSDAFIDVGYFDSSGVQRSYAGPHSSLKQRDYSTEPWFRALTEGEDDFIITDVYLGFRQQPHFTIGIKREIDNQPVILRATLDPGRMYEYISSQEGAGDVFTSIVNADGRYQLVVPDIGQPFEKSSILPPRTPRVGVRDTESDTVSSLYSYAWLSAAEWALIVQRSPEGNGKWLSGFRARIIGVSLLLIVISILVIRSRARTLVEFQKDSDRTRAQLEHAAKLASVGELAAGIAHEINNPLAVISEEAGLMGDLLNPAFAETIAPHEMRGRLDTIQQAAFRCRDITRKLLGFVRRTELDLKPHDVRELIDDVVDGLLGPEIAVSNIALDRKYADDLPLLVTDRNQLQQVILNILNNAGDAIGSNDGTITIETTVVASEMRIAISDSGKGMPPEQVGKVFLPFFTTKEVGKGTGLGLSVSYGIVKSLGGRIEVESTEGKGSTFVVALPVDVDGSDATRSDN